MPKEKQHFTIAWRCFVGGICKWCHIHIQCWSWIYKYLKIIDGHWMNMKISSDVIANNNFLLLCAILIKRGNLIRKVFASIWKWKHLRIEACEHIFMLRCCYLSFASPARTTQHHKTHIRDQKDQEV